MGGAPQPLKIVIGVKINKKSEISAYSHVLLRNMGPILPPHTEALYIKYNGFESFPEKPCTFDCCMILYLLRRSSFIVTRQSLNSIFKVMDIVGNSPF